MPHFAIDIDDFTNEVFEHLGRNQDGPASHHARFTADSREDAIERALASLRILVDRLIYPSDDYGRPAE